MNLELQPTSYEIWEKKYQLKDEQHGNPVDKTVEDTYTRVGKSFTATEQDKEYWEKKFALNF